MSKIVFNHDSIALRAITDQDLDFLFEVYASTRAEEMTLTGWSSSEVFNFLQMQFNMQHTQYMQNYDNPTFDIIYQDQKAVGRLYVNRLAKDMRIIDLAILPQFRRNGIAKLLFSKLISEAKQKGQTVSLHVEKNNPILPWYNKLGFTTTKDVGVYNFMELLP